MLNLIDIAANGFWGGKFKRSFLMLESLTLLHHPNVYLNLLIATMKKKRGMGV